MKLLFLVGGLLAATSALAQVASPPLYSTARSPLNLWPDMVGIQSADPATGATSAIVHEEPGASLPRGDTAMVLRVASRLTGQIDFSYSVQASDNTETVAAQFCALINRNAILQAGHITCQLTGSIVGITNFADNIAFATPLNFPANWIIQNGGGNWDAGPILYLNRAPANAIPPPGSSVGQIMFQGPSNGTPGVASVQYVMLQGKVVDADYTNNSGQFEIYTTHNYTGQVNPVLRVVIGNGVQICGDFSACPGDMGVGTISLPAPRPDGLGAGLFLGGRKLCIDPGTSVVYASSGTSC